MDVLRGSRRLAVSFALTALLSASSFGQSVSLSGHVRSAESGDAIPGASIGILGTTRGAKANRDSYYKLTLPSRASVRLRITALGYAPDTLQLYLVRDSSLDIHLHTSAIDGGTVVVAADQSRSEGRRIMHRVIDTKDQWQAAIKNYTFNVYSRINLRSGPDTSSKVLAILESYANGYWDRSKGYAERIVARKQTSNLPVSVNQIALFDLQNFYNDRVEVEDYTIVSPVAHDAFDRYDFDLLGIGTVNGSPVYKISVEPLNALFPAFKGTLWIDQNDFTIVYLDLSPNEAMKLGPTKDVHLIQTFAFLDNKYWLPNQLSFTANIVFDIPFAPKIRVEQSGVLQDYAVNTSIPDSIFRKEHGVLASADSVDSLTWAHMRAIPLAKDEEHAYVRIDSMVKLPPPKVSLSPLSVLFAVLGQPNVYQFNRAEGHRLQFTLGVDAIGNWPLALSGTVGYSFGQQKWKWSASASQALTWRERTVVNGSLSSNGDLDISAQGKRREPISSLSFKYFDETLRRGDAYAPIVNTLTALLLHQDYPNYYDARGFEAALEYLAGSDRHVEKLYYRQEDSRSDSNVSNFSLLLTQHQYRVNPAIDAGLWHYAGGTFTGGLPSASWDITGNFHGEYGWRGGGISGGARSKYYLRVGGSLEIGKKLGGWGDLSLDIEGDRLLGGNTPPQRLLFLETHDGPIRASGAFHTLRPFEFEFENGAQATVEQDFYDLPMRLIGVHLPFNLHWIGFADYAVISGLSYESLQLAGVGYNSSERTTAHIAEVGAGFGGILNLLRVDAAWRLTQDKPFVVTGSLEFSF